jgi:hypothetical protein
MAHAEEWDMLQQVVTLIFGDDGDNGEGFVESDYWITNTDQVDAIALARELFSGTRPVDIPNYKDRTAKLYLALVCIGKKNQQMRALVERFTGISGEVNDSERKLAFQQALVLLARGGATTDDFLDTFEKADLKDGCSNISPEVQGSPAQYGKRQLRIAEKETETEELKKAHPTACETCGTLYSKEKKLLKCAQCMSACYCSKECQVKAWKSHKKVCKTLLKDYQKKAASPFDKKMTTEMPVIPWIGIALPGHVTGYKKEVVCHVTPWAFDELGESVGATSVNRKAIVKSIKYFFSKYRTRAKVASRIPFEDVGDMCTDAIILFWAGYPGVRQITTQEGAHAHDKFLYQFHGLAPIPAGWTLDSQMTDHLPPAAVAMMNLEIDKLRKDPHFQGRKH